jgi:UDP-N-acetylglucosamine 2-epimerase (non-hydrolysing)
MLVVSESQRTFEISAKIMKPILSIIGTRPNYMKIAPIIAAFSAHNPPLPHVLIHTGQHYDANMEKVFFSALNAPAPDINLQVGAGSHAMQTGEMMKRLDPIFDQYDPAGVLVVGDVNSTLAGALVAAKRLVPLIHVEAGLRSGDRKMPEETNRLVVDQLSDLLFTTEHGARINLEREGISTDKIIMAGNVMIDSLERSKGSAVSAESTLANNNITADLSNGYAVVTLHRPSNVDDPVVFMRLIDALNVIAQERPVVFPVHPRTQGNLDKFDLKKHLKGQWHFLPPQGYFEMIGLLKGATIVCTDSGGVQEETTMLGVPCLTLRENTERPITVEKGTNLLVGTQTLAIIEGYRSSLSNKTDLTRRPELWDGHAAERIAAELWKRRAMFGWN